MNTIEKINARWQQVDSMAGIGLDPVIENIPDEIDKTFLFEAFQEFNRGIIQVTHPFVVDYKVNSNFYQGYEGRAALHWTFNLLKEHYPEVVRICDGKFGDVGHTAEQLADEIFGQLDADAVLVNPYMGYDTIEPFARWKDKAVIVCINTSNPQAGEIQNLRLDNGNILWKHILSLCMSEWNDNKNVIPVLSATHPQDLDGIRNIVGESPILLAGIGVQGGNLAQVFSHLHDSKGFGLMVSSSRGVLYPERLEGEDYKKASRRKIIELKDYINSIKTQIYGNTQKFQD